MPRGSNDLEDHRVTLSHHLGDQIKNIEKCNVSSSLKLVESFDGVSVFEEIVMRGGGGGVGGCGCVRCVGRGKSCGK